ncbi:MAG: response regulator transcription factor [Actinomycetaceae bacterium]|nr:response regulator transcription factor [Actinomycetaceae bacterium]
MISVVLVEDEHLIRSAIAGLIELNEDMEVVGQFASGEDALAGCGALAPDVAVIDLQLPGVDGIETAVGLQQRVPGVRTMILTSHGRPGYLKRALSRGVSGFMPKTIAASDLARAIRTIMQGGRAVDSALAAEAITSGDSPLSAREADALEMSIGGTAVKTIARRMHLSEGTVRNYLSSAQAKLGAQNRFEALEIARKNGWIG